MSLAWARLLGAQGFRPGSAISLFQGEPFWFLSPAVREGLRVPLDPSIPQQDLPSTINNIPITWTAQTFNSTATENIISAQPNRVILIAQNLSPTNAVAVNFDQTASVSGSSPNFVSQGLLLLPGVSLFVDKWCPTGTVHVSASSAPTVVVQGFSSIGNVPNIGQ